MHSMSSFELRRLISVAAVFAALSGLLVLLAYQITDGVASVERAANRIDDQRAMRAAQSAIGAMQRQIAATLRDNSYWDDAFAAVNGSDAVAWSSQNWGETTRAYPLYDTAVVVNSDGSAVIAYHQGEPLADYRAYLGDDIGKLVADARLADPERSHLPVAFIRAADGVALIGASAIQPYADTPALDRSTLKVLVLSKHLDEAVLGEFSRNFSLAGATLSGTSDMLGLDLKTIRGTVVGTLSWVREGVGTSSLATVWTKFALSAATFVLVILLTAAMAISGIRNIRRSERAAHKRATHDPLTALHNRAGLLEALDTALGQVSSETAAAGCVQLHLLDLDGFKAVNDAWGHPVGDQLIEAVGDRLRASLPASLSIARLGGDEFAVVLRAPADNLAVEGSRILSLFAAPFALGERVIEVGASVGSAAAATQGTNTAELMRRADLALYRSKASGRARAEVFDAELDEQARAAAQLEHDIRAGAADGEFSVAFQPVMDAHSGTIKGVEALARWHSPTRGEVSPAVFIAAAERGGLIDRIGFLILDQALERAADWRDIGLAINVSPLQLANPLFIGQLNALLDRHAFDPKRLTVEVTEGVLITNQDQAKRAISAMKSRGIVVALDDFGSGYASIGALREFGFDRLKVDRSLVLAAETGGEGGAVLQATISLARALQIPVTAEGIETEDQAVLVRLFGCDELQGFLYGRPVTAEEIERRYLPVVQSAA
jgi:diguanylate cyclase (GGDEF)-like protein